LHARLAADTGVVVEIDQAIGPLVHRGDRADLDTGRFVAVITSENSEVAFDFWKGADFDVFDPGAEGADGDVVLGFARGGTGVAAYTSGLVDDPGQAGHCVWAFGAACDGITWSWLGCGGWCGGILGGGGGGALWRWNWRDPPARARRSSLSPVEGRSLPAMTWKWSYAGRKERTRWVTACRDRSR